MKSILYLVFVPLLFACSPLPKEKEMAKTQNKKISVISLFGDTLTLPPSGETIQYRFDTVKSNYIEQLIWYGRFMAYKGDYPEAIRIFTNAIAQFPDEPRLYRHRGHRYISIREFDKAIQDLEKASSLIVGVQNEIEPDGMPNALNIPVSTLHGNIYYHLGLAYYLNQDWSNALKAYQKCLASTQNDDNVVSATHWLYMISRRMGDENGARNYLKAISQEMDVIENHAYHRICQFYKGLISLDELQNPEGEASSNDAVNYAIGNWYFYNGDKTMAQSLFYQITSKSSWNSFGYIAAEADLYYEFNNQ